MLEGILVYNVKNDRYGLMVNGTWKKEGFHCGERLEVLCDGEWIRTRMEMDWTSKGCFWYLVDTEFYGKLDMLIARIYNV